MSVEHPETAEVTAASAMDVVTLTDAAAIKVYQLMSEEENFALNLRAYVVGGGCHGFQYGFTFDEKYDPEDDTVVEKAVPEPEKITTAAEANGQVKLLIDSLSIQYLAGAEIDFVDDLEGAHFVINNLKAKTTCGCGSSFSV